jgi:glycosyltransferase involved in cell wall biosynthesis
MIVFYSVILNHHQAPVADELWELCKGEYRFVELMQPSEDINKGGRKYDDRPYLIRVWEGEAEKAEAMRLAVMAEVCVFGGDLALPYQKARLKKNLLSFEVGERWLKRGWKNLFSPRLLKMIGAYYLYGWRNKPLYKLCASAYATNDQYLLGTFKGKCFKWGYFTKVDDGSEVEAPKQDASTSEMTSLMWCARFLRWKHPELPVQLAYRLKEKGYKFHIDMFGSGEELDNTNALITNLSVEDCVTLRGNLPNEEILKEMRNHSIFLFTSDRNEGWGAVLNESMANGCVPVASDAIGSVPYLINDGVNGFVFHSEDIKSLENSVSLLLDDPNQMNEISKNALYSLKEEWSPRAAAGRLIELSKTLLEGSKRFVQTGPCSIAKPIKKEK